MKLLIKSIVAVGFCLPMAFAGCKEGCDCDKCQEKAEGKSEIAACQKCDKDGDEKEEGALA